MGYAWEESSAGGHARGPCGVRDLGACTNQHGFLQQRLRFFRGSLCGVHCEMAFEKSG